MRICPANSLARPALALGLAAAALALAACQSSREAGSGKSAALQHMEIVATAAHKCWFASSDPAFSRYSFANELDSYSGKPRFLLVPKGNYGARPLLVVEASGPAGQVTAYGPLMDGSDGARISADVTRWASGDASCGAAA